MVAEVPTQRTTDRTTAPVEKKKEKCTQNNPTQAKEARVSDSQNAGAISKDQDASQAKQAATVPSGRPHPAPCGNVGKSYADSTTQHAIHSDPRTPRASPGTAAQRPQTPQGKGTSPDRLSWADQADAEEEYDNSPLNPSQFPYLGAAKNQTEPKQYRRVQTANEKEGQVRSVLTSLGALINSGEKVRGEEQNPTPQDERARAEEPCARGFLHADRLEEDYRAKLSSLSELEKANAEQRRAATKKKGEPEHHAPSSRIVDQLIEQVSGLKAENARLNDQFQRMQSQRWAGLDPSLERQLQRRREDDFINNFIDQVRRANPSWDPYAPEEPKASRDHRAFIDEQVPELRNAPRGKGKGKGKGGPGRGIAGDGMRDQEIQPSSNINAANEFANNVYELIDSRGDIDDATRRELHSTLEWLCEQATEARPQRPPTDNGPCEQWGCHEARYTTQQSHPASRANLEQSRGAKSESEVKREWPQADVTQHESHRHGAPSQQPASSAIARLTGIPIQIVEDIYGQRNDGGKERLLNQYSDGTGVLYNLEQMVRRGNGHVREDSRAAPYTHHGVTSAGRGEPPDVGKSAASVILSGLSTYELRYWIPTVIGLIRGGHPETGPLIDMSYEDATAAIAREPRLRAINTYIGRNVWACIKAGTVGCKKLQRRLEDRKGEVFNGVLVLRELWQMAEGDAAERAAHTRKFENKAFFSPGMEEEDAASAYTDFQREYQHTHLPQDAHSRCLKLVQKIPSQEPNDLFARVKEDLTQRINAAQRRGEATIDEGKLESEIVTLMSTKPTHQANAARGDPRRERAAAGPPRYQRNRDGEQRTTADDKSLVCYRCGEKGHWTKDCEQPPCNMCNKRNCPGRMPGYKCVVKTNRPVPDKVPSALNRTLPEKQRATLVHANEKHRGISSKRAANAAENEDSGGADDAEPEYDSEAERDRDPEFQKWGERRMGQKKLRHANVVEVKRRPH